MVKESELQITTATLLNGLEFEGKLFWFHPPNGGWRKNGGKVKAEGMKAGVPDCVIHLPDDNTIFIELKTTKNSLQPPQKLVHKKLEKLKYTVYTVKAKNCYDVKKQVADILIKHGVAV